MCTALSLITQHLGQELLFSSLKAMALITLLLYVAQQVPTEKLSLLLYNYPFNSLSLQLI